MLHVILFEPEIPPNTGNIIRLCANTGTALHLIEPLGFDLDDAKLRRAGLDYHEFAEIKRYSSLDSCLSQFKRDRVFALSARASQPYQQIRYRAGDAFLFGPETRGLPADLLATLAPEQRLTLPMRAGQRSLNLSNAVAVMVYEAWRQLNFSGAASVSDA
jgi:tRNA (cytidine/uridine-2'-O-)-methyltransferase